MGRTTMQRGVRDADPVARNESAFTFIEFQRSVAVRLIRSAYLRLRIRRPPPLPLARDSAKALLRGQVATFVTPLSMSRTRKAK